MKGLLGIASLGSFIAGVEFSPGFFKEHDPELAVDGFGEGRGAVHVGDVLIHVDGHPLAFVQNFGGVVFDVVDFLGEEEVEDTVGSLGKGCQTCQEIAISKISLFDISGVRFINKYFRTFNFIRNLLPSDAIPFR